MIMTWFWRSADLACEKGYGVHTWFWNSTRVYTHGRGEPLFRSTDVQILFRRTIVYAWFTMVTGVQMLFMRSTSECGLRNVLQCMSIPVTVVNRRGPGKVLVYRRD